MPEPVELTYAAPRGIGDAEVADVARVQALSPTEDMVKGKPGYSRTYREDGSYEWHYRYEPNDGRGKETRAGAEAAAMLSPFLAAESERQAKLAGGAPSVPMRDSDGRPQSVRPEMADAAARRNGWHHRIRVRGKTVLRTIGSDLYRLIDGQWRKVS